MKYLTNHLILFVILLMPIMFISCGGENGDEPDNQNNNIITREQDRAGKIFLQNGILVDANTSFNASLLSQALNESNWKRSFCFFYDNNHISDIYELNSSVIPIKFLSDNSALFANGLKRDYSISGKVLTISIDPTSSTMYPADKYTFVSVDYSESLKRLVTDKMAAGFVVLPEGYDMKTTYLRIVWIKED